MSPPGVERSARLAFDAGSPDEVDSRLSALAELLKGLQVPGLPGVGGHALQRLGPFLESQLPIEAQCPWPRERAGSTGQRKKFGKLLQWLHES